MTPHRIIVTLTDQQARRLAALCDTTGRNVDSHINAAITHYLGTKTLMHSSPTTAQNLSED